MTDIRVTTVGAEDWLYCPRCGHRLELDQEPDAIVSSDDGIDVEASIDAGFNFEQSLSHCGYHTRVWVAEDSYSESLE